MAETNLNKLDIKRATKTTFDALEEFTSNALYAIDPEYEGNKVLATDTDGVPVETDISPEELSSVSGATGNLQEQINTTKAKVDELALFKFPNATIIGEPLISSGNISRFSNADYLQFPFVVDVRNKPFQIDFCYTTTNNVTIQQNILDSYFGLAIAVMNGKWVMALSSNASSWDIGSVNGTHNLSANTTYHVRVTWNGTQYKLAYGLEEGAFTDDITINSSLGLFPTTIYIGGSPDLFGPSTAHPALGTINMNHCFLYVDGLLVWQGMDDVGIASRADVSLSNIDEAGEKKIIEVASRQLANPYTLFDYKYTEAPLYNTCWAQANGNWVSGTVQVTAYEGLAVEQNAEIAQGTTVELPSGTSYTKRGLNVKTAGDSSITDYDFVLDTANTRFKLPTKAKLAGGKAVVGNGKTIGLTNGIANASPVLNNQGIMYLSTGSYDTPVSNSGTTADVINGAWGVTTDPTKSGIETDTSDLYLYFYTGEIEQNANLVNIGRIEERLSGLTECVVIIDSFVDSISGYNIYSNGYCEQWGFSSGDGWRVVNFIKTFANTNYNIQLTGRSTERNGQQVAHVDTTSSNITPSSMRISGWALSGTNSGVYWRATGYLAEGEY